MSENPRFARTDAVVTENSHQFAEHLEEPTKMNVLQNASRTLLLNKATVMKNAKHQRGEDNVVSLLSERTLIDKFAALTFSTRQPRNVLTTSANGLDRSSRLSPNTNVLGRSPVREKEDTVADSSEDGLEENSKMEEENANSLDMKSLKRRLSAALGNNLESMERESIVARLFKLASERNARPTLELVSTRVLSSLTD